MAYGITEAGFTIPTYDEWLLKYRNKLKQKQGISEDLLSESSVAVNFLSLIALADMEIWETMKAGYDSQTLAGAEDIYLDEIFGRRGVFREGATAASGIAVVKTLNTASWTAVVPATMTFTGDSETSYRADEEVQIKDRVYALRVPLTDFGANTSVTFYGNSSRDGSDTSIALNPQDVNFLDNLVEWLQDEVFEEDTSLVFHQDDTLYVGFESSDLEEPVGVENATSVYFSVKAGEKWSGVPCTAIETGFFPLGSGGITGASPMSFTSGGVIVSLDEVTSFSAFSDGSEIETDTEYRVRFNQVVDKETAATRRAIRAAILAVDGASKVRLYVNNTETDTPEALADSFNAVVYGGAVSDVAQAIYDSKSIDAVAKGSVDYVIDTEDGETETIGYTPADKVNLNVKVLYKTVDGYPLKASQVSNVRSNMESLSDEFLIGSPVFVDQLKSAVNNALPFGKIIDLTVQVKKTTDLDTAYVADNYETLFNELPEIVSSDVLFEQVV